MVVGKRHVCWLSDLSVGLDNGSRTTTIHGTCRVDMVSSIAMWSSWILTNYQGPWNCSRASCKALCSENVGKD